MKERRERRERIAVEEVEEEDEVDVDEMASFGVDKEGEGFEDGFEEEEEVVDDSEELDSEYINTLDGTYEFSDISVKPHHPPRAASLSFPSTKTATQAAFPTAPFQ